MNIVQKYKTWFAISLSVIIVGIVMFAINGFNLGIDFQGGTMIQYDLKEKFDSSDIKELLKEFNLDEEIIKTGMNETAYQEVIIRTKESLDSTLRQSIDAALSSKYTNAEHRETAQYSASVGGEIRNKAIIAVIIASIGMLIYISFRFEVVYGVTAIMALLHDVLILLAIYTIFKIPVNSAFIAAVLTVVGYSINDTIVVFDRIRENVKLEKRPNYFDVANNSLRQTIVRSINTSMTTLFVIGSLFFLGVDSIRDLALPLMAGVITGTYSSIFIASPLWALWKTRVSKKHQHYVSQV